VDRRHRNRLILVVIALVFAGPILTALVLNTVGWRPANTRNAGTLVEPPADVSGVAVTLADGAPLQWRDPQWHWTLLALANGDCADACRTRIAELVRLRITLGRNAERLRIVYFGAPLPAATLAELAPLQSGHDDGGRLAAYAPRDAGALTLALVDPNGLLMMRYDAGYDAARLRQDIVKVLH
jgi:hypothetical protein